MGAPGYPDVGAPGLELAAPDTRVHLGRPEGPRRTLTMAELLPLGFGAEALPG